MKKIKFLIMALVAVAFFVLPINGVSAAPVTASVNLVPLDPAVDDLSALAGPNIEQVAPLPGNITRQDPGGDVNNGGNPDVTQYAWRIDASSVCEAAQITALQLVADTQVGPGHDPTSDAVMIMAVTQSTIVDNISIVSGVDGGALAPGVIPDGAVLRGYGASVAGSIDATWNASFDRNSTMVIITQDNNVNLPPAWMQTEIQSVEVTYDDATCTQDLVEQGGSGGVAPDSTSSQGGQLARTGASARAVLAASAGLLLVSVHGFIAYRQRV